MKDESIKTHTRHTSTVFLPSRAVFNNSDAEAEKREMKERERERGGRERKVIIETSTHKNMLPHTQESQSGCCDA